MRGAHPEYVYSSCPSPPLPSQYENRIFLCLFEPKLAYLPRATHKSRSFSIFYNPGCFQTLREERVPLILYLIYCPTTPEGLSYHRELFN